MDGGFTLIVRCSGWSSTQDILPLDVYIPSKEIGRHRKEIEPAILQVVQVFAQSIAAPHICRLSLQRGTVSTFAKGCSLMASSAIPPAVETGSPHFRFHIQSDDNSEPSPDDSFDWSPGSEACKVHDSASAAAETGTTLLQYFIISILTIQRCHHRSITNFTGTNLNSVRIQRSWGPNSCQ